MPYSSRTSSCTTSHQPHPTFIAAWTRSADATWRHAACQTGSDSQPPSFGFLPASSILSTLPRLCTMRHRPASPCDHFRCKARTSSGTKNSQSSPECARRPTECVRVSRWKHCQLPKQLSTPLHPGCHVAPSSEFHEGVKATQELCQPALNVALARLLCSNCLTHCRAEPFFDCSSASLFACVRDHVPTIKVDPRGESKKM